MIVISYGKQRHAVGWKSPDVSEENICLLPPSCWFLACLTLEPERWKRNVHEKKNFKIFKDLHVYGTSDYERHFRNAVSVPECTRTRAFMCVSLAPERIGRFYSYLVFKNLPIIVECSDTLHIPDQNERPYKWTPGHKVVISSKTAPLILITSQQFIG
jgi:hypothetical protein